MYSDVFVLIAEEENQFIEPPNEDIVFPPFGKYYIYNT